MTGRSTIGPRDRTLPFGGTSVFRIFQVLDTRQRTFAIRTTRTLGGFVEALGFQFTAGRADALVTVRGGIVRVAGATAVPTRVCHDCSN